MREIKFRAWVEEPGTDKRWFYYFKIGETVSPSLSVVAWEQFTGLHDKNGKEIYEGDILQSEARGHAPVVYRYGGFFVELVDCEEFGTMYVPLNEAFLFAELIGNIHENPELLNG